MKCKFCWQFKTQRSFEPVLVIWVVLWLISSFFVNCCWQDGEYGNHDNARAVFAERSENFSLRFYSQYAFCVSFSSFSYRLSSSASSTSWSLCSSSCSPTYPTQCPRCCCLLHIWNLYIRYIICGSLDDSNFDYLDNYLGDNVRLCLQWLWWFL